MFPDHHREFVESEVFSELLNAAEADRTLASVLQGLKPKFDVSESAEVKAATKLFAD